MALTFGIPRQGAGGAAGYAFALLACAVAGLTQYSLEPLLGGRFAVAAFPPAVAAAAWFGGFGPGLLATVAAHLLAVYFFLEPRYSLLIADPADGIGLALVTLAGLLVSLSMRHLHAQARADRDRRTESELAFTHATHLWGLTAALSRAPTAREVIRAGLAELLHALDATAGAVIVVTDDERVWEIAHAVGYGDAIDDPPAPVRVTRKTPVSEAIRRQELIVIESAAARRADFPDLSPHNFLAAHPTVAVIPLVTAGRVIGVIPLSFGRARTLTGDERSFMLTAGRQTAQALVRALAYDEAQRARAESEAFRVRADAELRERQKAEEALRESEGNYRALAARTSRLYELSGALSEAMTLDAVAKVIVRQGRAVVGASAGSVTLLTEGGKYFETVYAEEYTRQVVEAWHRFPVEAGLCATAAVETRLPVQIASLSEWQKQCPKSAALAVDGGYTSAAALPLLAQGEVIGVLSFHFTAPVNFSEEYAALLRSVAQHCAQALDRGRLYEAAQRARADAESASLAKDDFLSTVSHELRTPLNAMLGWATLLRGGALDAPRTARALDAIFNSATRQTQLIEDLLDVSRIVAGRASIDVRECELGETLRGAADALMPLAESKGLELRYDPPQGVAVLADPRRLEQVFLNLLSNALKFTPPGGRIMIDTAVSDEWVDVRVTDTGTGIDAAFLPHVFDRFRQADSTPARRAGGLGLGLSIARHLVEAQGGTIRVESEGAGRGATFTVRLPSATGTSVRALGRGGPRTLDFLGALEPQLNGVRVLIVDDEPEARDVMSSALETRGASVTASDSARDALQRLENDDFHVLLADIAMPDRDGYALIRDVRGLSTTHIARIPAAAVTAYASDEDRERALAAGFQAHLAKPVPPSALVQTVADLVQHDRRM
ncbi:MAG: GAF domain-containing protein [Acidobacteria bacterium]|nr:GAF domain-containing protein [Acidobacteriota bacterium]